jgi:hypothetical protein
MNWGEFASILWVIVLLLVIVVLLRFLGVV